MLFLRYAFVFYCVINYSNDFIINKLELLPPCFSCNNNLNLSQSSFGSDDKKIVFEIPEDMIAGDLSNLIIDLSQSLLCPFCLKSNFISFPDS